MTSHSKLETILFVASKPLAVEKISALLGLEELDVAALLRELADKYNQADSGIRVIVNGDEWQMVSSPDNREIAEHFLKAEISEELTRPQLETLTVIAYSGPITKPELEQVRGVNCSLILRNLLMRGLVKEVGDVDALLPRYQVTMEFIRHLGLQDISELPDYEALNKHEYITNAIGV